MLQSIFAFPRNLPNVCQFRSCEFECQPRYEGGDSVMRHPRLVSYLSNDLRGATAIPAPMFVVQPCHACLLCVRFNTKRIAWWPSWHENVRFWDVYPACGDLLEVYGLLRTATNSNNRVLPKHSKHSVSVTFPVILARGIKLADIP